MIAVGHDGQASARFTDEIRVGHLQGAHDLAFERFHLVGLRVGLVVVALQVKEPVHGKMGKVMKKLHALFVAFALQRLKGDDNVTQHFFAAAGLGRKRQHVGRLVDAAPSAVKRSHVRIAGQHDTHFAIRC